MAEQRDLEPFEERITNVLIHETLVKPDQMAIARQRLLERSAGQTMLAPLPGRAAAHHTRWRTPLEALWSGLASLFGGSGAYDRVCLPMGMSHHYNLDRYLTYRLVRLTA